MQPLFTGRGRGRGRVPINLDSSQNDIKFSPSSKPIVDDTTSPSQSRTIIYSDESESGFSSRSSSTDYSTSSKMDDHRGRGRSRHFFRPFKEKLLPEDPYWMVTNLTNAQFHSNQRPKKPDELGTLGQQIQVIANYFPILQFPHRGLVYKYQIQIRNKKLLEIHRDRRR